MTDQKTPNVGKCQVEVSAKLAELPDYEDVIALIDNLPPTWVPALITHMALSAYSRGKIFLPGGASELIRLAELRLGYAASSKADPEADELDRQAADRLLRYYAGAPYKDVYAIDENGGGMHERDKNRVVEAYLAGHRRKERE